MEKDFGIYVGVCVQNNDPEMRGRIKIYIPQLSPNITSLNINVDKFFNFIDKNNPDITSALTDLKEILPWAEYAGPMFGGCASGRFNASNGQATTSDSNAWDGDKVADGARPANNFVGSDTYPDAFTQTMGQQNRKVNDYAYQYTPSNYSNLARGVFSIPNVGSHLYTFFINGDRNFPVYFASAYSEEDVKRIFTMAQDVNNNASTDYPQSYENRKLNLSESSDSKTFRSKSVFNSNKHTIEMIDTDLREILKFTHYSGSFKEFNNYSTIELATNNDQKMVLGNQFLTTQKNKSEFVKYDNEQIIFGDHYKTVGNPKPDVVNKILTIQKNIHELKMLFDMQRTSYTTIPTNLDTATIPQKFLSIYQQKLPMIHNVVCPVCKGLPYLAIFPDPLYRFAPFGLTTNPDPLGLNNWKENARYGGSCWDRTTKLTFDADGHLGSSTEGVEGSGMTLEDMFGSAEAMAAIFGPEGANSQFIPGCNTYFIPGVSDSPYNMYGPPFTCEPIPTHILDGCYGVFAGQFCKCCNPKGQMVKNQSAAYALGIGLSPSSEGTTFLPEPKKLPNGALDQLIITTAPALTELENSLGRGGDEIIQITSNKIETIGTVMNDLKSIRIDPIGKLKIDGCVVAAQGTYNNFKPSPHVEYVDVVDLPGDYILTAMNKYKLLVGSKGVNIQTTGPIDIYGTIVNITGEQLNISSENEIIVDGGERLTLRARKITLLPVEHNAVVVEGQLHVTRNTIIQGGLMCEGEVGLLHVTAPIEWQKTEIGAWNLFPDCEPILCKINGEFATVILPTHSHWFKNIPIRFKQHNEAVREGMIELGINSRNKTATLLPAELGEALTTTGWQLS
jgi:hypothetical protein